MSNVYKRNRTQSPMDVINKAKSLLEQTYSLIMNEKKVAKKHRYFLGKSLYDSANTIMCSVFKANNIFPRSEEEIEKRSNYQNIALYECSLFLNLLDVYSNILPNTSYKDVESLAATATSIKALIVAWKKSDVDHFISK